MKVNHPFSMRLEEKDVDVVAGDIENLARQLRIELKGEKKEHGSWWVSWHKYARLKARNFELKAENKRLRDILNTYLKEGNND